MWALEGETSLDLDILFSLNALAFSIESHVQLAKAGIAKGIPSWLFLNSDCNALLIRAQALQRGQIEEEQ